MIPGLTHLLSEPIMMELDSSFAEVVGASGPDKDQVQVCSYLIVVECLFKVSLSCCHSETLK